MKKNYLMFVVLLLLVGLAACDGDSNVETATSEPTAEAVVVSTATSAPEVTAVAPDVPVATEIVATEIVAEETMEETAVSSLLVPAGTPNEVYNAPFPLTITLDGDLSDWAGVPTVTIPDNSVVQWETMLTFAAAADDEYLYMMADVIDPHIISGQHGTNYWNEDSVEFYINAAGDLQLSNYVDGVAQITIPPLNIGAAPEDFIFSGIQVETTGAEAIVVATDQGYAIELAVPLQNTVWDIANTHGNVIGFQVHLNGSSEADRTLKAIWSAADVGDNSYNNPSLFGQLLFYEIGQDDVVANIPEPTPMPTQVPEDLNAPYRQPDVPVDERVADLLARMTLAEKLGQMTLIEKNSVKSNDITGNFLGGLLSGGGGSPADNTTEGWAAMVDGFQDAALQTRLGIPLIYGVDAVHGHSNLQGAVIFPHNIGLGAANNPDLMREIGAVTAREMIATGIYWNYAPGVMVPQDIRWGRTYEGYSENTDIVSGLASAYLEGLQGDDLAAPDTVLGTPKHFVGDGGTVWGSSTTNDYMIDQGVTEVDEETLRAVHLPPYVAVIEAGAQNIMISYSSWGGMKMHGQDYLINDVLIDELGFDGFIVSDWAGIDQVDPDFYTAVVKSINAGVDMNMVPYNANLFIETLAAAVEAGDVSMERIDEAVGNILKVKFEMGLFEHPYSNPNLVPMVGSEEHRAVAREAVAQSQVLLKNEGDLLPFPKDLPTLYVAGAAADDIGIQSGGWTIEWQGKKGDITPGTTILEAVQNTVVPETAVIYDKFGQFGEVPFNEELVCLAVVGEEPYAEGLGDSAMLTLPVNELRTVKRMAEMCDQLAVVLVSGRPLMIADQIENWDALVAAWLPGTEGQGVADVLFGDKPFTGKTAYTWPMSVEQLPLDFDNLSEEVLFPFGAGITTP
ncbi:MAG: glycoside hydrolase family 3 C-terminal domain-containing protein [Anaerolineales bacterium]|nr:glycoside hydrolase family 3 C-terminal domain-containing protein [Anaerolineales bacterium]